MNNRENAYLGPGGSPECCYVACPVELEMGQRISSSRRTRAEGRAEHYLISISESVRSISPITICHTPVAAVRSPENPSEVV